MTDHAPTRPARLGAAQTSFATGNYQKAIEELDRLDPIARHHPDALEMRYHIGAILNNWSTCLEAASLLVERAPERPSSWIQRSIAMHRMGCTREAVELLEPAVKRFPDDWMIPYNLARFACLSGMWDETWDWLVKALGTGDPKKVRAMALNDPDLKPFLVQFDRV